MLGWSKNNELKKLLARTSAYAGGNLTGRIDPREYSGVTAELAGHVAVLADRLQATGREMQVSSSKVLGAVNQGASPGAERVLTPSPWANANSVILKASFWTSVRLTTRPG